MPIDLQSQNLGFRPNFLPVETGNLPPLFEQIRCPKSSQSASVRTKQPPVATLAGILEWTGGLLGVGDPDGT